LYADDLVLLAESKEDLQAQLDVLHEFCQASCMVVNTVKSEVVVFNTNRVPSAVRLMYDGNALETRPHFVYLGVKMDAKSLLSGVLSTRVAKAKSAMHAMLKRCYELKLHNVGTQCKLFDALVRSVLNYGCEVWAPDHLSKADAIGGGGEAEQLHFGFLRRSFGVRASTPRHVMLRESARQHMNVGWLKQALGFFNRIMQRPAGDVVRCAMDEDITAAQAGSESAWTSHLIRCMRACGCDLQASRMLSGLRCNVDDVVSSFSDAQDQHGWSALSHFESLPETGQFRVRAAPDTLSIGFKMFTYESWFAPTDAQPAGYMSVLNGRERITAVARFRMGSHHLGIETGRWKKIPRSERICACCNSGERDDELHLLRCSLLVDLRGRYVSGFPLDVHDDNSVKKLMNGAWCEDSYAFWRRLSGYIVDANSARTLF
jgi:hypothetical protein